MFNFLFLFFSGQKENKNSKRQKAKVSDTDAFFGEEETDK